MVKRLDETMAWEDIAEYYAKRCFPEIQRDKHNRAKFRRWLLAQDDKRNYFDPVTWKRAFFICQDIRKDNDHFTVIVGDTGKGKSVLALLLAAATSKNFRIENISYDYLTLAFGLKNRKQYDTYLLDEGALILHAEDRKDQAVYLEKLGSIMRQFNLHVIICVPDLLLLRRYFRNQRINTLIHVTQRGKMRVFTGKAIKLIQHYYRMYEGDIGRIKIPNGTFWDGAFSHLYPNTNDITEETYKHLKHKNADDFLNEMIEHAKALQKEKENYGKRYTSNKNQKFKV